MRMGFLRILILLLMVVVVVGCGSGDSEAVDESSTAANAKISLEEVAQSGELGSGVMLLREALETLDNKELLADLDALEAMRDPRQIRAKAKAMADKL